MPDGRAYEMVSPPGKNGGDIQPNATRTRAAVDGNAVSFASLTGFGDVAGSGIATEYMSQRSSSANPGNNGWTTHGITPFQDPQSFGANLFALEPRWESQFSDDLSKGIFRAIRPLTDDPDVAEVENEYLRTDLRAPGRGSYQLLSGCPVCAGTPIPGFPGLAFPPQIADESADFSHVLFESALPLTTGAGFGTPNLYEWVNGRVRLAGVLPDESPAASSMAGSGASFGRLTHNTISADGSRVFFTDANTGNLYMRVDGATTVQLNASERSPADSPQSATFWAASNDGTRIFFTTAEPLTDDSPPAGDRKLYMYDATKPASDPHNLTFLSVDNEPGDPSNDVDGVLGTSEDGHYVYFLSSGQLVARRPLITDRGLFVWHDGTIAFIGELSMSVFEEPELLPTTNYTQVRVIPRVTPDGRHLLFSSHSGRGLLNNDHGTCGGNSGRCRELYLYNADTANLTCVSCPRDGAPATAEVETQTATGLSGTTIPSYQNHPMTADGRYVFFNTREALLPEDSNGSIDAYEYDATTRELHLISSGTDPADSYFMDATPDGQDVFFVTRQQLVGWDRDQNYDLYDARVGGGFPEPAPVPAPCTGEGCQGKSTQAPSAESPATSGYRGSGDLRERLKARRAAKRCRRGYERKRVGRRVKCVRKHKAKKAKGKQGRRHTSSDRRAAK